MPDIMSQINEVELEQLAIELIDYADSISDVMNRINSKMEQLNSCINGECSKGIQNKYSDFKSNYKIAKQNILKYSNDLIALIQKMKDGQLDMAKLFIQETDNINVKSQKIERL